MNTSAGGKSELKKTSSHLVQSGPNSEGFARNFGRELAYLETWNTGRKCQLDLIVCNATTFFFSIAIACFLYQFPCRLGRHQQTHSLSFENALEIVARCTDVEFWIHANVPTALPEVWFPERSTFAIVRSLGCPCDADCFEHVRNQRCFVSFNHCQCFLIVCKCPHIHFFGELHALWINFLYQRVCVCVYSVVCL